MFAGRSWPLGLGLGSGLGLGLELTFWKAPSYFLRTLTPSSRNFRSRS